MYVMPQTLTVTRAFTANRVRYEPGQVIPAHELVKVRSADMLLSLRYVIPTPDPHTRRTKPEMPTPTAQSAVVRRQILDKADDNIDSTTTKPAPKKTRQTPKDDQKPETDNDIQKIRDNFKKKTDGTD